MSNSHKNGNFIFEIKNGKNNKKVKITRTINIKVPKNATYKLNTRHSKVKLPKGKVSGKVSYGTFTADEIHGGDLKIYFAPVNINSLTESIVSLNNITDATIASVINSKLTANSSKLKIDKVFKNVNLEFYFSDIHIVKIDNKVTNLNLVLEQSEVQLDGLPFVDKMVVHLLFNSKDKIDFKKAGKKNLSFNGNFNIKTKDESIKVSGKYSSLTLIK